MASRYSKKGVFHLDELDVDRFSASTVTSNGGKDSIVVLVTS
ncbi:hypothetical protein EYZ11_005991 [Aspergillus tanneri]|uniref:Uncharacterized protein n=1 Tax=Aspergillus tanneri TaxID=1220188 RepID=A0A4S3JH23_9EURO|nr:hypothetical protein EYZ11_005991 [Aspergillus tanneri]